MSGPYRTENRKIQTRNNSVFGLFSGGALLFRLNTVIVHFNHALNNVHSHKQTNS